MIMAGVLVTSPALAQETALAELRTAARAAPGDVAAQTALGRALIEAGRLGEAETQMNLAVRASKGAIETLYEARRVDFATDNYKRARAGCQQLRAKDPKHVLTHTCMARAFLVWRRASRAFEHIDKALAVDPSNYEARLALADAKRVEGDFEAAKKAYEDVLAVKPSADAYLGIALAHSVQNRADLVLAALRKAYELDPDDPDVQYELGRRVRGPEAVQLLGKALAGRPGWTEAKLEHAVAQLRAGDATTAEATLRALLKQNPNQPLAIAHHGAALVALGRHAEAEPELRKALELVPNDYDTSFALAQLYERTDRNEDAFIQYRNAADLKRESALPLIAAARLGLRLKRPLLSGALLDKALEREPRSAEALALYGDVLVARGDKTGARDHYQRALAGEGALDRAAVQRRLDQLK
jgi:tetratricopeptide (TPR) repeat protein